MPRILVVCAAALCIAPHGARAQTAADTTLVGLWVARKNFGPDTRGRLVIDRQGGSWRAEIAGRSTVVRAAGDTLALALSGGAFTGPSMRGAAPSQDSGFSRPR